MTLPHSDACDRNKDPILAILRKSFVDCTHVLEIGSGTGQHCVYFATAMPGIVAALEVAAMRALRKRVSTRVRRTWRQCRDQRHRDSLGRTQGGRHVPRTRCTSCSLARGRGPVPQAFPRSRSPAPCCSLFIAVARYGGRYPSEGAESFDKMLRARDPGSGLRNFEAVDALARAAGFTLVADHPMPANNQTIVWKLDSAVARPA